MKKSIAISCFALFLQANAHAKPVDVQTAQKATQSFLSTKGLKKNDISIRLLQEKYDAGSVHKTYYVFQLSYNQQNQNGFVIVSADDIVKPILAYSLEDAYFGENNTPNVAAQYWTDLYTRQISAAITQNVKAGEAVTAEWKALLSPDGLDNTANRTTAVGQLLTTKWNQGNYYDLYTPGTGAGKTPVGCVATAMAQVMKYWNHPVQGVGSHSYYHSDYGNLSANFGNTTYQWSVMPNSLGPTSSTASKEAVSTLGYHCGIAVEMYYAPGASGSQVLAWGGNYPSAEYALRTYFDYSNDLQGLERDNYSDNDWLDMLKEELDNSRPVLYAGFGDMGGHAFIFDGYDNSDRFHVNWGWGGSSDGYFTIDDLSPSVLGTGGGSGGFNSDQQALFNLKPNGVTNNANSLKLASPITAPTQVLQKGMNYTASATIENSGSRDFTAGTIAAALYKASDTSFVTLIQTFYNQNLVTGANRAYECVNASNFTSVPAGNYLVRFVYKLQSSTVWSFIENAGTNINFSPLTLTDGPATIHDVADNALVTVYPNPANDKITIDLAKFKSPVISIEVLNVHGQLIKSWKNAVGAASYDVSALSNGMYFIRINTSEASIISKLHINR